MPQTILILLALLLFGTQIMAAPMCEPLLEHAKQIRTQVKQARRSENVLEVRRYARTIETLSDEAMSAAKACRCDAAFEAASACYEHALSARGRIQIDLMMHRLERCGPEAARMAEAAGRCGMHAERGVE